ncbi:uncharacterized protein LOC143288151 [Babylonia areolata]|uniref:uncharacterized protein LOC143288151 n=1 Tax=Babylonia areolata TaxID=304850 RepID=UPI003FD117D5
MLARYAESPVWRKGEAMVERYQTSLEAPESMKGPAITTAAEAMKSAKSAAKFVKEECRCPPETVNSGLNNDAETVDSGTVSGAGMATTKGTAALEAAKAAVVFMDLPEALVQLVIDLQPLEPDLSFSNAQELYELTSELLNNLERQSALVKKLYHHQKKKKEEEEEKKKKKGWTAAAAPAAALSPSNTSHAAAGDHKLLAGMSERSGPSAAAPAPAEPSAPSPSPFPLRPVAAAESACGCWSPEMMTDSAPVPVVTVTAAGTPPQAEVAAGKQTAGPCPQGAENSEGKTPSFAGCGTSSLKTPPPEKEAEEERPTTKLLDRKATGQNPKNVSGPSHQAAEDLREIDDVVATPSPREQLREKVRRLAKENWRLSQRKMCRACRKVELSSSGVTFLPCGHFITCEACSETFDDCPGCGKVIMGTVRTFLS